MDGSELGSLGEPTAAPTIVLPKKENKGLLDLFNKKPAITKQFLSKEEYPIWGSWDGEVDLLNSTVFPTSV